MEPRQDSDRDARGDRPGEALQGLSAAMGQTGELVARNKEIIAESRAIMERIDKLLPSAKAPAEHGGGESGQEPRPDSSRGVPKAAALTSGPAPASEDVASGKS
jgi:hypothetical protein